MAPPPSTNTIYQASSGSTLDQLKQYSKVVVDTGDFENIAKFSPVDSTTNPSLIFQAAQLPQYSQLIQKAISYGNQR